MAANSLVQPLAEAPDRPSIDLFARLGSGDTVDQLLARAGASYVEAEHAARMIMSAAGGKVSPGTSLSIRLGRRSPNGVRPIERIALRAGIDLNLLVSRSGDALTISASRIAVDSTPLRVRGRVGNGLYWALRAAGVPSVSASEYLRALATQIDVGSEVAPNDQFDLIIANRRAATGESQVGTLLYAAIDRADGKPVRLIGAAWRVMRDTRPSAS